MAISFQCPECGKSYNVGEELAGKRARCKCGQEMLVPEPAPVSDADAMSALLDAELPPVDEDAPPGHVAVAGRGAGPLRPVAAARRKSQSGTGPLLWIGIGAGGLVGLAMLLVVVFLVSGNRKSAEVGGESSGADDQSALPAYASPEEVFQANLKATVEKDWETLIRLWTPKSQENMIGGVAFAAAMLGGDDPKIGELMGKHGIDESLWKGSVPDASKPSDFMQAMQKNMQAMQKKSKTLAAAVDDKPAFFAELMKLLEERGEELTRKAELPGMDLAKLQEESEQARQNAKLVDVQIDGDTAQGKQATSLRGKEVKAPVEFRKIDGSWFLHQPDVDFSQMGPFANPTGANTTGP